MENRFKLKTPQKVDEKFPDNASLLEAVDKEALMMARRIAIVERQIKQRTANEYREKPWEGLPVDTRDPSLGLFRMGSRGEIEFLVAIKPGKAVMKERNFATRARYAHVQKMRRWIVDQYSYPPPTVVTQERRGGRLVPIEDDIWVAAVQANLDKIVVWYSPSHSAERLAHARYKVIPEWDMASAKRMYGGDIACEHSDVVQMELGELNEALAEEE